MSTPTPKRRGFTLIEFLVVGSIVATLLSLVTPALQQAREAARQSTCKNNLKQMAIALHNYHDVYNAFPLAWNANVSTPGNGPRSGWQISILPFMDQAPLYEVVMDVINGSQMPPADALIGRRKEKLLQTHIENYRCPSDTTSATNPMRGDYGTSNYSGNHGSLSLPRWTTGRGTAFWPGPMDTPRKANGIMWWNSRPGFRDITDGASNTFMIGERCVTSGAGIWPGVGSNEFENDVMTECSHGSRPNRGLTSFSSAHPGGVQFVMCDGRVVFINDNIDSKPVTEGDLGIYQRLANRHDGLPVGDF